jgi:hypothetical protein
MENSQQQTEELYKTLSDPQMESNLLKSARNLDTRFHSNWFTIEQIMKKTNIKSVIDARQLMNMLELKGFCKKENRSVSGDKYKITLSKELQIQNLKEQVVAIEIQKDLILRQIETLEAA